MAIGVCTVIQRHGMVVVADVFLLDKHIHSPSPKAPLSHLSAIKILKHLPVFELKGACPLKYK